MLGLKLDAGLPAWVASALLVERLEEPFGAGPPLGPSEGQIEYLDRLCEEVGRQIQSEPATSRQAAAWIEVLHAARSVRALERLEPQPGDVVAHADQSDCPLWILSSISADGRINFEGGLGAQERPHRLRMVARASETGEKVEDLRRQARNGAARRRSALLNQPPSVANTSQLEPWSVDRGPDSAEVSLLEETLEGAEDERPLQACLEAHPALLRTVLGGNHGNFVMGRTKLGAEYIPDFLLAEVDSAGFTWTLVEIESPKAKVLKADGELADRARHAIDQIQSWRSWLVENLDYARKPRRQHGLGLTDIRPDRTRGLVVVGRRESLVGLPDAARQRAKQESHILVHTYDWLLEKTRGDGDVNLLGPIQREFLRSLMLEAV